MVPSETGSGMGILILIVQAPTISGHYMTELLYISRKIDFQRTAKGSRSTE